MTITSRFHSVAAAFICVLFLASCVAELDEGQVQPERAEELTAVWVTFASPAAAEAAAASVDDMDDGSLVLAMARHGDSLQVLATESTVAWLLDQAKLVNTDAQMDKNSWCAGYCGGESPYGCFCDD